MSLSIGLFIDDAEDRDDIISDIKLQFMGVKAKFIESICPHPDILENNLFDMIVIDYGGLTSIPGNNLGERYARYINKYAEDHPNTLILYVTVMGKNFLENEGINFEKLCNIQISNIETVRLKLRYWRK